MFPERLKELRINQNITQSQLAESLNLTNKSISAYEKGTSSPSIETLHKIALYFNVTIDYLTGFSSRAGSQDAGAQFNISEKAITIIKHLSNIHMAEDIFSDLLQEPFFMECLEYTFVYLTMSEEEWEDMASDIHYPTGNPGRNFPETETIRLLKSTFQTRITDSYINALNAIAENYRDSGRTS